MLFHILDSLPTQSLATNEAMQLQNILIQHFEDTSFQAGQVVTKFPQVFLH